MKNTHIVDMLTKLKRKLRTGNVSIEESIAIFFNILAHNLKFRVVSFHYYCSKETISRQLHNVLHAMMKIICKQKPRRKIENQEIENEGEENNYFRWNVDMERALVDILCEEQRLGNKRRWCGFNWDAIKKMISSHGGAKRFCWKIIPIVDLCDKDRTMGEGAEIGVEAVEIMTHLHDEPDHIDLVGIDIINQISPITKKLDPTEVYDEVNAILDLSEEEQIKAYAWLIENDKQFVRLKTLPIEKKKNMVLLLTSRGA
ncbi:unnamed protein product [Malus baccata var. baccata]